MKFLSLKSFNRHLLVLKVRPEPWAWRGGFHNSEHLSHNHSHHSALQSPKRFSCFIRSHSHLFVQQALIKCEPSARMAPGPGDALLSSCGLGASVGGRRAGSVVHTTLMGSPGSGGAYPVSVGGTYQAPWKGPDYTWGLPRKELWRKNKDKFKGRVFKSMAKGCAWKPSFQSPPPPPPSL